LSISQVITLINQMEADGVVERYALGGAVGATFYLEPVATLDVDIFVASLANAVTVDVDGTPARVFTAEHLAAIALETGRAKDKARLLQFIEAGAIQGELFQSLLARYGLVDRWIEFEKTFLKDTP